MRKSHLKNRIFALGYAGWRNLEDFIDALKGLGVGILIDVRRFPTSKNPDFMGENLKTELPKHGIRYVYMGDLLGGYRRGGYRRYMETEEYMKGIRRLLELAKIDNIAIMCLERKSKYCHRRFIIETLSKMGIETIEIEK